ncbi:MAG: ketoacyl-ACP synthase III [Saprospiraceae bacterium]
MIRSKIADLSVYHPARIVTNQELEARLNGRGPLLAAGSLERLFGSRERRFAAAGEQASDLAVAAARPILERTDADRIGFLIFAGACADLIEPATANIVQHKLGLHCPAMDVKNACNSFTSGLLTASSLIAAGVCDTVLVLNGEKLSDAIRFDPSDARQLRRSLAAYTLGDAGAAALVTTSEDDSGFHFQRFMTRGAHWPLCTIPGGGSMYPHDVDKTYFEGQTDALKKVLAEAAAGFFHACLQEAGWQAGDVEHLFTHQVSAGTFRLITQLTGIDPCRCEEVFTSYGNTAAASIPLAMHQRLQRGLLQKGDRFALIGLAAGVSVSVQLGVW